MSRKKLSCFLWDNEKEIWGYYGDYDIFDLPYENISIETPLCISEDVDLRKYRPQSGDKIPFLKNVFVRGNFYCSKHVKVFPSAVGHGVFDCSKCGKDYIDRDTELPKMKIMDCSFSITGLDVLFGKLPNRMERLIVEKALIDKKNLLSDPKKLAIARRFVVMYPNITVVDTAGRVNLWYVLDDIDHGYGEQQNVSNTVPIIKTNQKNTYPAKTDQDIDVNDIIGFARNYLDFDEYDLTENELKRFVKIVMSDSRLNNIYKYRCMRGNETVICVNKDALNEVLYDLKLVIQEAYRVKEKISDKTQEKPEVIMPEITVSEKPKPIKIKKYISYSDYKKICSFSSLGAATSVLKAINEINMDPTMLGKDQVPVRIIQGDKIVPSQTVKKKYGCALAQSIDRNSHSDRKRVVWTVGNGPDGLVIVCVGVLDRHSETDKERKEYRRLLESAKERHVFSQDYLTEKYMNVSEILDIIDKVPSNTFVDGNGGNGGNGM